MNTHSTTSNEGWIEWNGGECPVEPDALIRFQIRCESREEAEADDSFDCGAGGLDWRHNGNGADIVAYRIVEMPPETSGE